MASYVRSSHPATASTEVAQLINRGRTSGECCDRVASRDEHGTKLGASIGKTSSIADDRARFNTFDVVRVLTMAVAQLSPLLLPLLLLQTTTTCEAAAAPHNFIIYQPDEMRAESLGCYGHAISKTPNFDAFAKQATRFDQAHTSYTVCTQSRAAFMTAWPTHVMGHRSLWNLLHDWEPNLLKYLKTAGYQVKWWGKNDLLAHDSWNRSVTSAMSKGGKQNGPNAFKYGEVGFYSFLNKANPTNDTGDHRNVEAAIEYLLDPKRDKKQPFMIFLPLTKPHPPYSVPEPWYSQIDPASLPPLRPSGVDGKPDYHALIREYRNLTSLDETFFRKLHAVYLGSIGYVDFLFGLLLAALDASGQADSTTVAVFADHGDYAGDYGLVEKWPSGLEDVLTRVPLLVRTPGGVKGHVVHEPVQLFDIVPTVLELAGINASHVHFGESLVKQIVHGEKGTRDAVFSEGGYSTHEPRDSEGDPANGGIGPKAFIYYPKLLQQQEKPLSVCRAVSVRTLTHKLVLRTDPLDGDHCSELYDLQADPQELHNLYNQPQHEKVQAGLTQRILRWMMTTSDVTRWTLDPRSGGYPWNPKRDDLDVGAGGGRGSGIPVDVAVDTGFEMLESAVTRQGGEASVEEGNVVFWG